MLFGCSWCTFMVENVPSLQSLVCSRGLWHHLPEEWATAMKVRSADSPLPLVSLSDHLSCCRDWWCLVESVHLTSAFNPCLAEQHCKLSSFLHFSSAMRCMEYCHLVIVGPLMILIGYGLWQLLRRFNSVSENLSLWDWNNSYSVVYHVEISVWHYDALQ